MGSEEAKREGGRRELRGNKKVEEGGWIIRGDVVGNTRGESGWAKICYGVVVVCTYNTIQNRRPTNPRGRAKQPDFTREIY